MRTEIAALFILVLLAWTSLGIPVISAAAPPDTRQIWPIITSPELNVTGADISNHTIPIRYGISPAQADFKVEISATSLPGPKGEMAAGPRSIGFSADPLSLAILIVAVLVVATGTWYMARRKPEEPGEEDT